MSPATAIWTRIVVPDEPTLAPDVARHFLSVRLTDEEKARYQFLASKDQVDLSPAERSELEALVGAEPTARAFTGRLGAAWTLAARLRRQ